MSPDNGSTICLSIICEAYLFDGVQRGSYGYDRHENNSHSIVVILIGTPQDHTEELEDVERVEDLQEDTETNVSVANAKRKRMIIKLHLT